MNLSQSTISLFWSEVLNLQFDSTYKFQGNCNHPKEYPIKRHKDTDQDVQLVQEIKSVQLSELCLLFLATGITFGKKQPKN